MALELEGAAGVGVHEAQHDGDYDYGAGPEEQESEDLGLDLLARARLLCQAANEIALPMLRTVQQLQAKKPSPPKARKQAKLSRPSTREEDDTSTSQSRQKHKTDAMKPSSRAKSRESQAGKAAKVPDTLPPIAAPPQPNITEKKAKGPVKPAAPPKKKKKKEEEEDEPSMPLPQINATDEWRKQREAEKIRQAQERAKARVLRKTNYVDALPTKSNQQAEEESGRPLSSEHAKEDALSQIEANRRRALERVKLRKLELAEEQARAAAAKQEEIAAHQPSDELNKKTEAFRHRTLQRLQAARREAQAQDMQSATAELGKEPEPQEDPDEKEKERKRLAKQRRRETADRLKRLQQIAEEQKRKEQEMFEKGLSDFKAKKKEQDRVAKGLAPKQSLVDPPVVFEPDCGESQSPQPTGEAQSRPFFGCEELPTVHHVIMDSRTSDDTDCGSTKGLSPLMPRADVAQDLTHLAPSDTTSLRPRAKKVPSWKQPPVPVLPAECYTQKAMVSPSESYSERFQLRSGRTSPTAIPDATFSPPHAQKLRSGRAGSTNLSEGAATP